MIPRQLSKLELLVGPIGLTPDEKAIYAECKRYISYAMNLAKSGNQQAILAVGWVQKYMPVDLSAKLNKIVNVYNKNKAS